MNKINIVKIFVITSIIGIVLLSGCLENDTSKTTPLPSEIPIATQPIPVKTEFPNVTEPIPTKTDFPTVAREVNNLSTKSSSSNSAQNLDWCKSGTVVTKNGVNLTIKNYNSTSNTCYAELKTSSLSASYSFNKDKTVSSFSMAKVGIT